MSRYSEEAKASAQMDNLRTPQSIVRIPLWISIVVILGALLTLTGAVLSKVDPTLLTSGSPMTDAARVYADYMFARNLALALMLFLLLALRERRMLAGFMGLIALIQVIATSLNSNRYKYAQELIDRKDTNPSFKQLDPAHSHRARHYKLPTILSDPATI